MKRIGIGATIALAVSFPAQALATPPPIESPPIEPTPGASTLADGEIAPVPIDAAQLRQPPQPPPPRPYSPSVSAGLAIGTTVVGWGVAGLAFVVENDAGLALFLGGQAIAAFGPSAGHLYAGEGRHAAIYTGIRAAALVVADLGVAALASCAISDTIDGDNQSHDCGNSGGALMLGGFVVAAGFGLYDWIDAPRAARRANTRAYIRGNRRTTSVIPIVDPTRHATGLALVGTF